MTKELLFTMSSLYRDDFNIYGYRFGSGKKALAVVGALRGDELEQQFTCASLINRLAEFEKRGALVEDYEILVIPSVNPSSMNIGKRFWSMDNTDINRMFPGYDKGETTQRIAAGLFESVKDYEFGIQLASHYIPGEFVPHVRMLDTGYHPEREAKYFGLPYVFVKDVTPYDTTLLNYNWQIWGTKAFSMYTGHTEQFKSRNVDIGLVSILRFMVKMGLLSTSIRPGFHSAVIRDSNMVTLSTRYSGFLRQYKSAQDVVVTGELMAEVLDPYDASVLERIVSPMNGVVFFSQERSLVIEGSRVFQVIEEQKI
ncbi:MAG: M14 family metallopeptidase [Rikenellaceae bacterium]